MLVVGSKSAAPPHPLKLRCPQSEADLRSHSPPQPPGRDSKAPPLASRTAPCLAGFYNSESDLQSAIGALRQIYLLEPRHIVALRPRDAATLRFKLKAMQWARPRTPRRDRGPQRWYAAAAGALVPGVAAAAWLAPGMNVLSEMQLVLVLSAMVLGGLIAAGLTTLYHRPLRATRFDQYVQSELAKGSFAMVAHRVPLDCQGQVMAQVSGGSQRWCAAAPRPKSR